MPSLRGLDILAAPAEFTLGEPSLVVLHGGDGFLVLEILALVRSRLCPDEADRVWAWREFSAGEDFDPDELMSWVATEVAPQKRIRLVETIDAIPKSPSGKILRRVLVDKERAG